MACTTYLSEDCLNYILLKLAILLLKAFTELNSNKLILMSNIVSVLGNIVEQRFKTIVWKGIIRMHTQTISMLVCSVLRIHKKF